MQTGLERGEFLGLSDQGLGQATPFLMTLAEDLHFPNTDFLPREEPDRSSDVSLLFLSTN